MPKVTPPLEDHSGPVISAPSLLSLEKLPARLALGGIWELGL